MLSALAGTLTWPVGDEAAPVAIKRLEHLEDWIDAHVGEAITLGRLCEVAQIGERSLQLTFQRAARHVTNAVRLRAAPCRGPAAIVPGRAG